MNSISFGELLVDMVSGTDATLGEAASFIKAPGGAPANVAVGMQRLGSPCAFMGQVGNDPFGHWLKETIEVEGVDVSNLALAQGARTTIAFVATRSDGKKDICFYRNPGADAEFAVEQLHEDAFKDVALLHCGSVSLSLEPCRTTQLEAVHRAKAAGALISFDPNWRPSLWDDFNLAHDLIWQMIPLSDIVKVADEEWEFVTGSEDFAAGAAKIRSQGPKLVVITKGSEGAYFNFEGGEGEMAGFKVDAVDTLGAGDSFVAGLLTLLLENGLNESLTIEKMTEILRFANGCGAIATLKPGAIPGLPTRGEVEEFLLNQKQNFQPHKP